MKGGLVEQNEKQQRNTEGHQVGRDGAFEKVALVLADPFAVDEEKVSAKRIQRILRHKAVSTTERYIRHLNEDLTQEYKMMADLQKKKNKKAHWPGTEKGGKK